MPQAPLLFDGFTTQEGGMNNGRDGSRLGAAEMQLLINGTTRGDFARQRPGHRRIMQVVPPGAGLFQHFSWLKLRNGTVYLAAVINGRFYRVDPLDKTVSEFTIPGDPNPNNLLQGWSIPSGAEGFWIYQDSMTAPLIWNGASARRATTREIKPGRVMAYVQGRIWYSLPDELSFRATDLVGNQESGTPEYRFKDSILRETENDFLNEGGDFTVPANSGGIRAMAPTAILDTSQGQGPLQVFCEKTAFSVNTPVEREIWKVVRYPIQTVSLIGSGASSQQSTINVNQDIFMRAEDGIRSFIIARRNFRDWGNTPQSFEVSNIIRYDQPDLLAFSSAAVFDNRMFMTCSPGWSDAGVYHRGLIALDLSPISSLRGQAIPKYDGLWTGYQILAIQQTDIGTYMLVLTGDGAIDLWQLTKDDLYDNETGRISWSLVPRTLFVERDGAGRPIWNQKKLETADLFYDELAGAVDFSISWKPDGYPCWTHWKAWEECAPVCTTAPGCTPPKAFQTQYRPRYRLADPPDECVEGTKGLPLRNFYTLNLRLDVIGPGRILGMRAGAQPISEERYKPGCVGPECLPVTCCEFDLFAYVAHGTSASTEGGSGGSGGSGAIDTDDEDDVTDPPGIEDGTGGLDHPAIPPEDPEEPPPPPGDPDDPETPPNPPNITGPDDPFVSFGSGALTYQPVFDDGFGNVRPMGYEPTGSPPADLMEGVLEQWKAAVLEQFLSSGIVFSSAQLFWQYSAGDQQLRYNPNLVFGSGVYGTAAWKQEIWVEYLL